MKVKMKVIPKNEYGIQSRDKAAKNRAEQADVPKSSKRKFAKTKKDAGIVASWMSPQRYKGFKSNFK